MKISVITATFNSAETIADCLNSFSKQNYLSKELIIVDGKSTDGTLDVLATRHKEISEIISENDSGIYDALNKGISLSKGDIVGFLHSDDEYASCDVLSDVADVFKDECVCAVYGDLVYVDRFNSGKIIRKWVGEEFTSGLIKKGWMPAHPTLFVRREFYIKIGGFSLAYPICADYDSIIKLFGLENFYAVYIPKLFIKMRIGGKSNNSPMGVVEKFRQDYLILRNAGYNKWKSLEITIRKRLIKIKQIVNRNNAFHF